MKIQPKPYFDKIRLKNNTIGNARRLGMTYMMLENAPNFPLSVEYDDIDKEMLKWVENELDITFEGVRLPTFKLYSNQRIGEYSQSWEHLDSHGNLIMNFKTLTRENNPKQGKSQGEYFNIPGNRDYPMFIVPTLQKNGTEAYDLYTMKQPLSVDFMYTVGIITNKYELINQMNMLVLDRFKALEVYISPNNHPMPLKLDGVSDESEYALDDRKYYSQTYTINLKAYIIRKEDYKVERIPSRTIVMMEGDIESSKRKRYKKSIVSVIEDENETNKCIEEEDDGFYFKPIEVKVDIPMCDSKAEFIFDTNFQIEDIELKNVCKLDVFINGELIDFNDEDTDARWVEGDEIKVSICRNDLFKDSSIIFKGYDFLTKYRRDYDVESELDNEEKEELIIVD